MFRNAIVRATAATRLMRNQQTRSLATSIIYINNLPIDTDEAKLTPLVEKFGPVFECHFPSTSPDATSRSAFVKLYSGDLPSTIEELAALPTPNPSEVSEVTKRGSDAIAALSGAVFDGHTLHANFARKNMPDAIQFHARMTMRKASDPEFASRTRRSADGSRRSPDYTQGYKDGFRDGMLQARRNAGLA
ncbi:hypothetical protein GGI12_005381 [Dipsacomyces acuminosporus]|nr:hypothetical protein GGI12_005381 [Dipsacomyces acuminosporus]